jgi:polysaccharide biosynthesis protein PelC
MRAACALALTAAAAGCAGTRPRASSAPVAVPSGAVVALIPFEDLSGRENVADAFTRIFMAELVRTGTFPVLEEGVVEDALDRLSIRSTRGMTSAEMHRLGDSLHVTHLLFGNVIEAGELKGDEGGVPSVAATLRLVEIASGRVVWACHHSRTGEDRETVFQWGRERSQDRLIASLAVEMLEDLRKAGARSSSRGGTKS